MNKLILILLCVPLFLDAQHIPTFYTYDGGQERYIDRHKEKIKAEIRLERAIDDFIYEITQITETEYQKEIKGSDWEYAYLFYKENGYIPDSMYWTTNLSWEGDYAPYSVEDVYASSTLVDKRGRYNYESKNISDNDLNTAWVEGESDYGIGEYIEFEYIDIYQYIYELGGIIIYNGFQKSIDLWKNNSRVKTFKVYVNNVPLCFLELPDKMASQNFFLTEALEKEGYNIDIDEADPVIIRLEIYEVYKGDKWKDVCISDILIMYTR